MSFQKRILQRAQVDYPMSRDRYISSWKVFRSISDENVVTAKHILSLSSWANVKSILDLGCGDGLIMKSLLVNSPFPIDRVTLLDIDKEMLEEAEMHVNELGLSTHVTKIEAPLQESFNIAVVGVDLILAVHIVYLISFESFVQLITTLPKRVKLIIIMDDEDSVFTMLWKITAPKYAERSSEVRKYLDQVSKKYFIKKTTIVSKITNPFAQHSEIKNSILSLISYADAFAFTEAVQQQSEQICKRFIRDGFIECTSVCYELTYSG